MVREVERKDLWGVLPEVGLHLLRRTDAGQKHHGDAFLAKRCQGARLVAEKLMEHAVAQRAEEKLLIGTQAERILHHAEIDGGELCRTFAHDDNIGTVFAAGRLAEVSGRKQPVACNQSVVIDQQ